MKKVYIVLLIIGVLLSGVSGYVYYGYKYKIQLEDGLKWENRIYLNSLIYKDITDKVQIVCNFGNKKIISGRDSNIKFLENDFDSNNNFIGYYKNELIQQVCEISEEDKTYLLAQLKQGVKTLKLADVKLITE